MPYVITALVLLLEKVIAFFAIYLPKKVAIGAALTAFFVAGIIALQLAAYAAWTGLAFTMPPFMLTVVSKIATLLPSNFAVCVGAIVSFKITRFVRDKQVEWAKMVAYVT